MMQNFPELEKAISVISKLRDPSDGCPWDLKQTHQTLLKYLVEESYEYIFAVHQGNKNQMCEELGDVLLQVLLHSEIARQNGDFDLEDVASNLASKMIERHPHVFKRSEQLNSQEVLNRWDQYKMKNNEFFFKEDDAYLPGLMAAHKIGAKSAKVNFDWDNIEQVFAKVEEEFFELKEEFFQKKRNMAGVREELGDLLFSLTQLSRHLDFDPEEVLREANLKFIKRFNALEKKAKAEGRDLLKMNVDELEELWQSVKKQLKKDSRP